jgi:phosphocarrier protein
MVQFDYTVTDELGIHARPAGLLVKLASGFKSDIKVCKGDQSVDVKRLMGLMKLGIRKGDTAAFTIEGEDEKAAADALKKFMQENL